MPLSKQKLILALLSSICIVIALLGFNGQYIANRLGWGWRNNLPDHLNYHGRAYSLGISGCRTRTDVEGLVPSIVQIETMPMLFGSSYPQFAPENQVRSNGVVVLIFVEESNTCYRTYALEGGP